MWNFGNTASYENKRSIIVRPAACAIFLLVCFFCLYSFTDAVSQEAEWVKNGHKYKLVLCNCNWDEANASCQASGGYLATITSQEENAFVWDLFAGLWYVWYYDGYNNGLGPWIGGFQPSGSAEPSGGWRWVTGEAWAYSDWTSREPDNCCGGQNKLRYFRQFEGLDGTQPIYTNGWDDGEAFYSGKCFILEKDNPKRRLIAGNANAKEVPFELDVCDPGSLHISPFCDIITEPSVFAPQITICKGPSENIRKIQVYFYIDSGDCPNPPCAPYANLDVAAEIFFIEGTGGHCHGAAGTGIYPFYIEGNTGNDGLQFGSLISLPEAAGRYGVKFFSRESGKPFYDAQDTTFVICIRESEFAELPADPAAYELIGGTSEHPRNHFGTHPMIDALVSLADGYLHEDLQANLLGFNDMSLPFGGVFDFQSLDFSSPHCGHRFGNQCDLRTSTILPEYRSFGLKCLLCNRGFNVYDEGNHFHITLIGQSQLVGTPSVRNAYVAVSGIPNGRRVASASYKSTWASVTVEVTQAPPALRAR